MSRREPLARRTHLATWLAQPMVRTIEPRRGVSALAIAAAFVAGLLIGLAF